MLGTSVYFYSFKAGGTSRANSSQVQWDQCKHLIPSLFPNLALLFEGSIDLILHPPTPERLLGAAQQHFIPEPDSPINLVIDVITRMHLLFVQPASDAVLLQVIVQLSCEFLILVTVADEAGIELHRLLVTTKFNDLVADVGDLRRS